MTSEQLEAGEIPAKRPLWVALTPDMFTLALVGTVALASFFPARGDFVPVTDILGRCSIILLFFLHGASLSRKSVIAGVRDWRLHLIIFSSTFLLFPVIGLALSPLSGRVIDSSLYAGLLFLCCLPSTVQSSIAFTSIARGNVPAAVCSASLSNLSGVFITPLLAGLLLSRHSAVSFDSWTSIFGSILLPFLVGQLVQTRIGPFLSRHKSIVGFVDRGSVLIMVYAAFGKAVVNNIWSAISIDQLLILMGVCVGVLATVMFAMRSVSRHLNLSPADEATVVFCGSKKSLITGIPMASILFPAASVGAVVLPLMIYHQIQLIVCAFVARAYRHEADRKLAGNVKPAAAP